MMVSRGGAPEMATVVVAVKSAEGRGSRRAVRWAVENLMQKADRMVLVHVMPTVTAVPTPSGATILIKELDASVVEMYIQDIRAKCEEIFLTFRYLYRSQKIETLLLEGDNPAFALLRYISDSRITSLVLGSCSSNYFARKPKDTKVPSIVLKHAPDTCDIYVISANKLISNSLNPMLTTETEHESHAFSKQESSLSSSSTDSKYHDCFLDVSHPHPLAQTPKFSSMYSAAVQEADHQVSEDSRSDIMRNKAFQSIASTFSEQSDTQAEIERLRLELKNTLTMYNRACEDLVHAQRKVHLLSSECIQEAQMVKAAQEREQNLRKIAAVEREKYLEAEKEIEIAKKLLDKETYERQMAELNARKESLEKKKIVDALLSSDRRYRRYTIDDIKKATGYFADNKMIGEGAYGKVYKCSLDHALVAVKALHTDASNRKEEFLREVEVLSQLRHPHILLLLGACPENGCLVYEYMENGSLEDHILRRRGRPFPWHVRFRIAFEVACGLAFLHHSKPEPIVHRDLKPGNILLDKYYVSKIGDVGLAKIIYDIVPDNITEYRDSVIAGTLFYMDPEYQRTGTLRPKSDLYSFGVIVLQLLAARHPNGLIMKFENAISNGALPDILDKSVADWPVAEAEELAQIALKCCKLRCRDRPDLEMEVLPILKRLAEFADSKGSTDIDQYKHAPKHYYCPILQEIMDNPYVAADGFTYEHDAIKAWLDRHSVSPVTKEKLQHKMITPNHMLHSAIQEWRKRTLSR